MNKKTTKGYYLSNGNQSNLDKYGAKLDIPHCRPSASLYLDILLTGHFKALEKSESKKKVPAKEVVGNKFDFKNECLLLGVDKDVLDDWLKVRKAKKSSNTKTALMAIVNEVKSSEIEFSEAIKISAQEGWAGFKLKWCKNIGRVNDGQTSSTGQKLSALERVKQRNDTKYRQQPNECGLGVGTNGGHLGGAVDEGERGNTIEHVDNQSFTDY